MTNLTQCLYFGFAVLDFCLKTWDLKHIEADGPIVFKHACSSRPEAEGLYRSGRSADWFKSKNLACAAVKREAEEDWEK